MTIAPGTRVTSWRYPKKNINNYGEDGEVTDVIKSQKGTYYGIRLDNGRGVVLSQANRLTVLP